MRLEPVVRFRVGIAVRFGLNPTISIQGVADEIRFRLLHHIYFASIERDGDGCDQQYAESNLAP